MLKVGSPQQPAQEMGDMPPMPTEDPNGMQPDPTMGGEPMPIDGGQGIGDENPYDSNFDAGVDADEETDPKRYIQQLTGKLSQSLRIYNEQQPQPDTDLNKYVAGMITKQASEGLTKSDIDEIISKLNSPAENPDNRGEAQEMTAPNDGNPEQEPISQQQGEMPMESLNRNSQRRQISELFQELTKPKDDSEAGLGGELNSNGNKKTYRNKPFSAPQFS